MNSYAKFGGAARRHFSAICEKPMGGGTYVPPPTVRGLTRALLGLWIFHRLLGGGRLNAPPMISAPGHRREKQKAAFESWRKIISKSFRSYFGSG